MKRIFVNGTFDMMHRGHLELLKYARSLGDQVWVAIDSDRRAKKLKGAGRPVETQEDRKFMLESLKYVDLVFIFDSDDELEQIIKGCKPEIMVKGSDYKGMPIIGSFYCKKIVFFERLHEYSTTKTLQNLSGR
jgi:D-beta-D-heptose 7-phosphate kinase/D-beta-D-heptose 1-phosphate adenosyltransferase